MGRQSKRETVTTAVNAYLALAETHSPEEFPLDVSHVAKAVGCVRSSLYNFGLQHAILAAAQRQRLQHPPPAGNKNLLRQIRTELVASERRNRALLERLNLVEANALRLGIDADALYQPLLKPSRLMPSTRRRHLPP